MGRDTEVVYTNDRFVFSRRCNGFIPKTIFLEEPTAVIGHDREVLFFQDFGIPNVKEIFVSIDESSLPEVTAADIYDFVNRTGRYWNRQDNRNFKFHEVAEYMAEQGIYSSVKEHAQRKPEEYWIPTWPAMMSVVEFEPDWRSVDFDEDIERRGIRKVREAYDRMIAEKCGLCRTSQRKSENRLSVRDGLFVHGRKYLEAVQCVANKEHDLRGTRAPYLERPHFQTA